MQGTRRLAHTDASEVGAGACSLCLFCLFMVLSSIFLSFDSCSILLRYLFDTWYNFSLCFPIICSKNPFYFVCVRILYFIYSGVYIFVWGRFYIHTCAYEHVVEHLAQAHHITRNQPCTKQQSKNVPTRARQRKQTELARAAACRPAFYSSLCSQNERRNRNLLGPQNIRRTTTHKELV